MTITTTIAALTAFFKAVPVFKEWFDRLVVAYVEAKVSAMKRENRDSIKKALNEQDQRDMEKKLGSSQAGEASGIPGTVIVDHLPGVRDS